MSRTVWVGIGGAASWSLVRCSRYGAATSSGSADSSTDSAWPNFIAPPLSSPRVRNSCSAVRCWISVITASAGAPPIRLPNPIAVRPAYPKRQRRQPRRARGGLAGQVGHGPFSLTRQPVTCSIAPICRRRVRGQGSEKPIDRWPGRCWQLVADRAAQDAVAARFRADAAATRVRVAADLAATAELDVAPLDHPAAVQRAARTAAIVQAAAVAVAEETAALAACVSRSVALTAELLTVTRATLDRAIEAEVEAAAAALELHSTSGLSSACTMTLTARRRR